MPSHLPPNPRNPNPVSPARHAFAPTVSNPQTQSGIEARRSDRVPAITALGAREQAEQRRQVRGLLLIVLLVIVFTIVRAGVHRVFNVGWWRLW